MEENCMDTTVQKARNVKGIQMAVCCALLPNIIKDVFHIRSSIAYPVGIFIGSIIAYWLPPVIRPPDSRFSFVAWIWISLAASLGYWLIRNLVIFLW
jgi:hypothetical protein